MQGSGWGVLAYEPLAGRLIIEQVYDHQGNVGQGHRAAAGLRRLGARLLPPVQERKADFFAALWNVVNWPDVAARLEAAKALKIPG